MANSVKGKLLEFGQGKVGTETLLPMKPGLKSYNLNEKVNYRENTYTLTSTGNYKFPVLVWSLGLKKKTK